MNDWKPYIGDRIIREHRHGFYVIKPADVESTISISCAVCHRLLRTSEDESSTREFMCCYICALRWAHPRREKWKAGWRPSREEVENDLKSRPGLTVHIKVD